MSSKRLSLKHFRVWGCKEVRPYNPLIKKLDLKIVSGFFIGYCIGSRGSKFYCPSHTTRSVVIPTPLVPSFEEEVLVFLHNEVVEPINDTEIRQQEVVNDEHNQVEDFIPPRRLERISKPTGFTKFRDYFIYLQEHEISLSGDSDPNSFQEACKTIRCKWVFKTKRDAKGKIEIYKTRLVAKRYD
ncbi:hypothetical protein CR513_13847, partial [Mucuna pruriens]